MPTETAPQPDPTLPVANTEFHPSNNGADEMWRPPYYAPAARVPAPTTPTNLFAILAFVFACVGSLTAIPFGHIARKQIARTGEQGSRLALAGLILGYVWLAFLVLLIIVAAA